MQKILRRCEFKSTTPIRSICKKYYKLQISVMHGSDRAQGLRWLSWSQEPFRSVIYRSDYDVNAR